MLVILLVSFVTLEWRQRLRTEASYGSHFELLLPSNLHSLCTSHACRRLFVMKCADAWFEYWFCIVWELRAATSFAIRTRARTLSLDHFHSNPLSDAISFDCESSELVGG